MDVTLEKKLLKRFPHLYYQYYQPMIMTCMCWGFSHGDGWFPLIWQLSLAIEDELKLGRWHRFKAKIAIKKMNTIYWIKAKINIKAKEISREWVEKKGKDGVTYSELKVEYEPLPWHAKPRNWLFYQLGWPTFKSAKIAVSQVKEKFGTLRYYDSVGEKHKKAIGQLVGVAMVASGGICETCGEYGKTYNDGYIRTSCSEHRDKSEYGDVNEEIKSAIEHLSWDADAYFKWKLHDNKWWKPTKKDIELFQRFFRGHEVNKKIREFKKQIRKGKKDAKRAKTK